MAGLGTKMENGPFGKTNSIKPNESEMIDQRDGLEMSKSAGGGGETRQKNRRRLPPSRRQITTRGQQTEKTR